MDGVEGLEPIEDQASIGFDWRRSGESGEISGETYVVALRRRRAPPIEGYLQTRGTQRR